MKKLLCLGHSYTAHYLIDTLNDFHVTSTKRKIANSNKGIILWKDLEKIDSDTTHILVSIPPIDNIDIVYNKFYKQIINLKNLKWLGYLSTTSVYGDHQGKWVNEESATNFTNERSKVRLNIEQQWLDLFKNYYVPVSIFRLSGIYGPERNYLERIYKGENIQNIYTKDKYFSRIHVKDIAVILKASMDKANIVGEIYNLADDYPCPSYKLVEYAYKLVGKEIPKRVNLYDATLSPMMREFYNDNKKVDNTKVKMLLGDKLMFKSYKEGLRSFKNNSIFY